MTRPWFDPADPPRQPPPHVRQPLMWWMGARLIRDHQPRRIPWQVRSACRACARRWPCPAYRLGARGLVLAHQEPPDGRSARGGRC